MRTLQIPTLEVDSDLSKTALEAAMERYQEEYESDPAVLLCGAGDHYIATELAYGSEGRLYVVDVPLPYGSWMLIGPKGILYVRGA